MKHIPGTGYLFVLLSLSIIVTESCNHDSGVLPTSVKKWTAIELKSVNEVPAPVGRTEEGDLTMELLSDNSLKFEFHVYNLSPGDLLTAAHIHFSNAGESGPVLIDLKPSIAGSGGTGTVKGLRQGQVDTLLSQPVYFNIHSTQVPAGIVRGQLDQKVDFALDIALSGNNEVPAVTTTASGLCILRMTEDKTLYSKVTVTNIETNDTIRVSHIHRGAAGSNGPVRIFLASSIADFGILKTTALPDSLYNMIKNDPIYINAHSKLRGSGLVRGQVR